MMPVLGLCEKSGSRVRRQQRPAFGRIRALQPKRGGGFPEGVLDGQRERESERYALCDSERRGRGNVIRLTEDGDALHQACKAAHVILLWAFEHHVLEIRRGLLSSALDGDVARHGH